MRVAAAFVAGISAWVDTTGADTDVGGTSGAGRVRESDEVAAGAAVVRLFRPISPRVAAATVHSIGATAGEGLSVLADCEEVTGSGLVTSSGVAVMTGVLGSAAEARGVRWAPTEDAGAGVLSLAEAPPRAAPDDPRRLARVADSARDGPASAEALDPLAPADPELSAKAIGMADMPPPTPRAKASAPTRPTYRA
jgi:hypothetical protein